MKLVPSLWIIRQVLQKAEREFAENPADVVPSEYEGTAVDAGVETCVRAAKRALAALEPRSDLNQRAEVIAHDYSRLLATPVSLFQVFRCAADTLREQAGVPAEQRCCCSETAPCLPIMKCR